MNTWSKLARLGAAVALVICLGAVSAHADVDLFDNSHTYDMGGGFPGAVTIAVDVDKLGGLYLWQYTITNNTYTGGNGISGFELGLPAFPPDLANATNNLGWDNNCCSGKPEEWDHPDVFPNAAGDTNVGPGIGIGQSGVFSFTSLPRTMTTSTGWLHTWSGGGQTDIHNYTDTAGAVGPEVPNVLVPPTPEPGTLMLFGSGLVGVIGAVRRRIRS